MQCLKIWISAVFDGRPGTHRHVVRTIPHCGLAINKARNIYESAIVPPKREGGKKKSLIGRA